MRAVVVTGVSTGIGYAIAKVLVEHDIKVFGSVRSTRDAERVAKELGSNFVPLIFDITQEEDVKKAALFVRDALQGEKLWGLVNNAGIAVPGPLIYLDIAEFKKQIETNLTGHLIVTQAFVPLLGVDTTLKGKPGKIINISSVAGKMANPFLGAYSSSKHALEALSDSLRIELLPFGIDVVVIGPGAIQSDIWEKGANTEIPAEVRNSVYGEPLQKMKEYMLTQVIKSALPAVAVGLLVLKILSAKKTRTRYAIVPHKLINWTIPRLLPKRLIERIIAKKLGLIT